ARALPPHRQSTPMPDTAVTIDRLQPLQIALNFSPQIAFDRQFARGDRLDDLVELFAAEVFRADVRVDVHLLENLFRRARPHAVNVWQRSFDAFLARNFYSK